MPSQSHVFMYHFMVITAGCQIMAKCQFGLKKGPRGLIYHSFTQKYGQIGGKVICLKIEKYLGISEQEPIVLTNQNTTKYFINIGILSQYVYITLCKNCVHSSLHDQNTKNVSHIFNGHLHEIDIFQHCEILCETRMQVHIYGTKLNVRLAS